MSRAEQPSRRTVLAAAVAAAVVSGPGPAVADTASATEAADSDGPRRAWSTTTRGPRTPTGAAAPPRAPAPSRAPARASRSAPPSAASTTRTRTPEDRGLGVRDLDVPVHRLSVPATETIASWNAHTPAGTWLQVELRGTYSDGTDTPWYVMGRWAAGDQDIKRTSVDDQTDGKSTIWTDTFAIDDATTGLRLASYRLRLTLYRKPGTKLTPTVWRLGAMGSDIPDRFTVPASTPGSWHGS
jgi:hypothetical protein